MVQFDKGFEKDGRWAGFTDEERNKMKEILKDAKCQCESGKCSINCDALCICDACYDEDGTLTPFCLWTFEDCIYGEEIIRDIEGDTVCKSHRHDEVEEEDKRSTCPKCGFKTDSETIMKIHSCRASQRNI